MYRVSKQILHRLQFVFGLKITAPNPLGALEPFFQKLPEHPVLGQFSLNSNQVCNTCSTWIPGHLEKKNSFL